MSNLVLSHVIDLFAANKLVLNLDRMNIIKFVTNNLPFSALSTVYKGKYMEETVNIKFPGLPPNLEESYQSVISKLSGA